VRKTFPRYESFVGSCYKGVQKVYFNDLTITMVTAEFNYIHRVN